VSHTEPVLIVAVVGNGVPFWAEGLIGRFNPVLNLIDLADPLRKVHSWYLAEAFRFERSDEDATEYPSSEGRQ
jgi:hypothetical protein